MSDNTHNHQLTTFREKVVNNTYILISSLGILIHLISFTRNFKFGLTQVFHVQTVIILLLLTVTYYRKRLSLLVKTTIIGVCALLAMINGMFSLGFLASAKIYICTIPVLIAFLIGYRKALIFLAIYLLTYVGFAYLYVNEVLRYGNDIAGYLTNVNVWSVELLIFLLVSATMLAIANGYTKNFTVALEESNLQKKELEESKQKYQTLFEASNDAIFLLKDGVVFDCNQKTFEMFGCNKSYIYKKNPADFSPTYQPDGESSLAKLAYILEVVSYKPILFEWQHKKENEDLFFVSVGLTKITLGGEPFVQSVLRDISLQKQHEEKLNDYKLKLEQLVFERTTALETTNEELQVTNEELYAANKRILGQHKELQKSMNQLQNAQSQLIQSEKMASLGVLTAGVAHEINNPLNFISGGYEGLSSFLRDEGQQEKPEIKILLKGIKTGLERATSIVKSLSEFSHTNDDYTGYCHIHSIIENCLLILNNRLKYSATLNKEYADEELSIMGNCGKLHQVFTNIISNAEQALDGQGEINIKTYSKDKLVVIEVADTGCGISKENLTRVTDPFFTTKDPGKGTGLGLSISYAIIKEHGGLLEFDSEVGKGTRVRVILPYSNGIADFE